MSGSLLFGFASAVAKGPRGRGCAMHRTTAGMDLCHATRDPSSISHPRTHLRVYDILNFRHQRLPPLMHYLSNCE